MSRHLHSLLEAIGLEVPSYLPNPKIKNLSCDSQNIEKGDLFLGLKGEKVDGGVYWDKALASGACAAIISKDASLLNPASKEKPVVVFPDPIALWIGKLSADFWRDPSSKISLIGVTGTNGKTTTSYLIEFLSSSLGIPSALLGTLVNRWPSYEETSIHTTSFAVPLQAQLARAVKAGVELVAMEVSSHALSQQRVAGCHFSGAIFTNLSRDHLDYHDSMEMYFRAKANLFRSPLLKTGNARAIVNVDDKWGSLLANDLKKKCWTCSLDKDSHNSTKIDLFYTDLKISSDGCMGKLHTPTGSGKFFSPLVGEFNLMNTLQGIGILVQQGLPLNELLDALGKFPGVPGRMQRINIPGYTSKDGHPIVLVDYAHTPDGLKNALIASRSFTKGKLICVFGCGGDRDRGKRSKMGEVALKFSDYIVLTSDNPRQEDPQRIIKDIQVGIGCDINLLIEQDRSIAIQFAISKARKGDVVLIAGKGHEDYQILGDQKIYFDDRNQAELALRMN